MALAAANKASTERDNATLDEHGSSEDEHGQEHCDVGSAWRSAITGSSIHIHIHDRCLISKLTLRNLLHQDYPDTLGSQHDPYGGVTGHVWRLMADGGWSRLTMSDSP